MTVYVKTSINGQYLEYKQVKRIRIFSYTNKPFELLMTFNDGTYKYILLSEVSTIEVN